MKRSLNVVRLFLLFALAGGLLGSAVLMGQFVYYGRDLPDIRQIGDYRPPQISRVYAADGTVIGEFGQQKRTVVSLEEMPSLLLNAFVAAEDAAFFQHAGVDFFGVMRAMARNLVSLDVKQGASTITQQVVKNLLLSHERSLSRKISEIILAYQIEQSFSKREILAIYANEIYFGNGTYGVAEAARFYFGKRLGDLTLGEIAYLAGLPKNPEGYALNRHPDRAQTRQQYVLGRLLEQGYVDRPAHDAARDAPLAHAPPADAGASAPYVVDAARAIVEPFVGRDALAAGGLLIYTSIDPRLQTAARRALRDNLTAYDRRHGYRALPIAPAEERETWKKNVARVGKRRGAEEGKTVFAYSADFPPSGPDGVAVVGTEAKSTGAPAPTPFWRTFVRRLTADELYFAWILAVDAKTGALSVSLGVREGAIAAADAVWALPAASRGKGQAAALAARFVPGQAVVVALRRNEKGEPAAIPADGPVPLALSQVPLAQSALFALDPRTRRVLALEGGFSHALSPFDRVTQALRQPGSAFKPFVYLAAMRSRRFTPATQVEDKPVSYPAGGGRVWSPKNFDGKFRGPMRLREALTHSINTVAVQLVDQLGPAAVVDAARTLGVGSPLEANLTLALGTSEVTLWELVNAYATLPAEGQWAEPVLVERVATASGRELYRPRPERRQAIAPEEAALMAALMQSVVQEGTARRARALGRPLAGKTGTTNDHRDAWFIGFSPTLVAGAWVGYDEPQDLGSGETGGRAALPAWIAFMKEALAGRPIEPFVQTGLVHAWIDPETGFAAAGDAPNAIGEVFLPGTGPEPPLPEDSEIESPPQLPTPPEEPPPP